jgi:hypothetical protein
MIAAYNSLVAESVKTPKEPFNAVIRALLKTPPTPMADIPRKRGPKALKRRAVKKRASRAH